MDEFAIQAYLGFLGGIQKQIHLFCPSVIDLAGLDVLELQIISALGGDREFRIGNLGADDSNSFSLGGNIDGIPALFTPDDYLFSSGEFFNTVAPIW